MTNITNTLRIDASARRQNSISRELGDALVSQLETSHKLRLQTLDLTNPLPIVTAGWVDANSTPGDQRNMLQEDTLSLSDKLVEQLEAADLLIITTPIYNFGVPAALKAWIDQVARAGRTFRYTEKGPVGLLEGKRAIVVVTSGGTRVGSEIDFTTPYLRHVLGFIGIHDVQFVAADALGSGADESISQAKTNIEALAGSFH